MKIPSRMIAPEISLPRQIDLGDVAEEDLHQLERRRDGLQPPEIVGGELGRVAGDVQTLRTNRRRRP